jgi:uncharacterized protein (DUF1501 family)
MKITRRQFLKGCTAGIAVVGGAQLAGLSLTSPSYAATLNSNQEMLITISLRGGMDGLNLIPPYTETEYYTKRPNIAVPAPGSATNPAFDLDGQFGMHPAAGPLHDLYQNQDLAVIHATGLINNTRSHFDAVEFMERGTPNDKTTPTGWMTRHLISSNYSAQMPAVAAGYTTPALFRGSNVAVAIAQLDDFNFNGYWRWEDAQRYALRHMYNGDTWLHRAGEKTLNAIDIVEVADPDTYTPEYNATYPSGSFGDRLKILAQLIKLDVGLHLGNVDFGDWDTHEHQGTQGGGYFADHVSELANGLMAFYTDLTDYAQRLTIVVISEFGRRLRENDNQGTDHGHGNAMLVIGGNVNGGQVFTDPWPGLAAANLDNGLDLAITTDYRRIFSEILIRRLGNPNLGIVFPGYTDYTPMGVVSGTDLTPNYVPASDILNVQSAAALYNQPVSGEDALWDSNNNGIIDDNDMQVVQDRWKLYWRMKLQNAR